MMLEPFKVRASLWLGAGVLLGLLGCVSQPESTQERVSDLDVQTLLGPDWIVFAVDGVAAIADPAPRLRWSGADYVGGSGGCNSFVGKFSNASNNLKIGPLAATRMLCIPTPQGQEDKFFKALENTQHAHIVRDELHLLDGKGSVLIRLRRQGQQ